MIGWDGRAVEPTGPVTCDHKWSQTARAYEPRYVLYVRSSTEPIRILVDGQYVEPCSDVYQRRYRRLLRDDVDRFAHLGATTVLVTALPIVKSSSMSAAAFASEVRSTSCGNEALRAVARAEPEHAELVDLEAKLCPTPSTCRAEWKGVELRPDRTHFEGRSARIVAAWILDHIGVEVADSTDR